MPDGTIAPEVMTAGEVAKYLRIDKEPHPLRVLSHLRASRQLRSVRVGAHNQYRLADVLEFLERRAKDSF